ncbi:MAG: hypothetical protein IKD54_00080, partial [Clostridia bacterium]|nr:hypothetical protein [Clostridia bacterium]
MIICLLDGSASRIVADFLQKTEKISAQGRRKDSWAVRRVLKDVFTTLPSFASQNPPSLAQGGLLVYADYGSPVQGELSPPSRLLLRKIHPM